MSAEIRVIGPKVRKSHLGTTTYWDVEIYNEDTKEILDLAPWNERCSLRRSEAVEIANHASRVTRFKVREFRVERKVSVEYVEVDQESA